MYFIKFTESRKSFNPVSVIILYNRSQNTKSSCSHSFKTPFPLITFLLWPFFFTMMLLFIFGMVSPTGLSEALLPISGCDFRRERVCFAWCQALMFKYAWLKQTLFHMRIWLCRGWCSWLFNLSESFLDSANTEIPSGFCCLLSRVAVYYATVEGTPAGVVRHNLHIGISARWNWTPASRRTRGNLWLSINSRNGNIQGMSSPHVHDNDNTNLLLTFLDEDHRADCSSGMKEFRSMLPETNSK